MELKELQITCKYAKKKIINDFLKTLRAYHFACIASLRDILFVRNMAHLSSNHSFFTGDYLKNKNATDYTDLFRFFYTDYYS